MSEVLLRNRYRLVDRLGEGGGGTVYAVDDLRQRGSDSQRLALKALFSGPSQQSLLRSLKQEFGALATLRHPLVARVYDFGSIPQNSGLPGSDGRDGYFFTRDLVDGADLQAHCAGLPLAQIILTCQRTAEALEVLHRSGLVHGDFKPANVIVSSDGQPHLIDFGLVRTEGQDGRASGTAAYLAPETLAGEVVDRRIDLYALGISIYQLVVGNLPLPRGNLAQLVAWHMEGPALRTPAEQEAPEALDEVLHRLTQRDPDRRYPTAGEAALALAEAAAQAGAAPAAQQAAFFVPPAPGENLTAPLARLEQAVDCRLMNGEADGPAGALIVVESEPGGGKSTLLQELAWRCQLADVEVFRGEFHTGDPRTYGLWSELLSQVAGLKGIPHPLESPSAGETERYAVYQQMGRYLARCSEETPLLLLLDNLHEADEESLGAVRFLAHTLSSEERVMLVAAHPTDEALNQRLGSPERVLLEPLSLDDLGRMTADASGRRQQGLAGRILAHTGGNPLFAIEVLRRLGEEGWPADPDLRELAPPRSLEQMYAERWQELTTAEQEVLQALAVLGRPCRGSLLLQVLDRTVAGLDQVGLPLERLESSGWLTRNPEGRCAFQQAPAARVVERMGLDEPFSRRLHGTAVKVLGSRQETDPVELTRHALGAQDLDTALNGLDQALGILRGLGASRRAIELCEGVAALLEHQRGPVLRGVQHQLGKLYHQVADYEQARAVLERALIGAGQEEGIRLRITLASVLRTAGEADQALATLRQVLDNDPPAGDAVEAMSEAAAAHVSLDQYERVLEITATAVEKLQGCSDSAATRVARAKLKNRRAWALGHLEQFDASRQCFEEALADARAAGDPTVETGVLNSWIVLTLRQADFSRAAVLYNEALQSAQRTEDIEQVAVIRYNLALYHLWRGEYAACLGQFKQSLRLFEAMGAQQNIVRALCGLGQLQLQLCLFEQARSTLRRAIKESREVGSRLSEAASTALLALVQAHRGRLDQARQGLQQARALYCGLGLSRDSADVLLDLARLELDAHNEDQAMQALEQAAAEVDLDQVQDLAIRAAVLRARWAAKSGTNVQRDEAAMALKEALLAAQDQNLPELTWECHAAAMELTDARGLDDLGALHAREGASILEQMAHGLPPEVRSAFWQDPNRLAVRQRAARHHTQQKVVVMDKRKVPDIRDTLGADLLGRSMTSQSNMGEEVTLHSMAEAQAVDKAVASVEERFYRLLEIYRQVNSELDPERLLGLVMDTSVELTGAERGFLLLGSSPDDLQVEVARNLELGGEEAAYSRSIADKVFTTGQPVITVSARNDPRFKEYLSVHQLQLESVLCIPIHARESIAGVLYMESRFQTGRFTPADQRLLMAFGDQVAIALTNARLLSDNIQKARKLEQAKQEIEALAEERGRLLNKRTRQLEQARKDLVETRRMLQSRAGMFGMVGRSAPMAKLFHLVERVSSTDVPVLIEGESGTGKEMVARAIHENSPRKKKRLVSVNCAAIPEGLLESELFGHVRGAFTGADRERKGLFLTAHGGTLFLDEIGDMPARMQVDLLRALQEKTIRPVGAQKDIQVDVRIIAASNKPLAALVQQGAFREDLFYRLKVVTLELPPLRQRADDVPLLVDHFLDLIAGQMNCAKKHLTRAALRRLMDYSWPGNVRQLEHALMNASVLADTDELDQDDFTLEAPTTRKDDRQSSPLTGQQRQIREKEQILEALEACNWNKSKAARRLGMPRRTFYRRLKNYQIN